MSVETADSRAIRVAYRIRVAGHVQGVGFRPFVKRLADQLGLFGCVGNDFDGVYLEVEGERQQTDVFANRLSREAPPSARIEAIKVEKCEGSDRRTFEIVARAQGDRARRARVPNDLVVCSECLSEMRNPADRRFGYAFTSCSACGPRYTVLSTMPYERAGTSMKKFPLCPACAAEFGDAADRRFHAEVMACPRCGPHVRLQDLRSPDAEKRDTAIGQAAEALARGEIVALKGLGGYQLLVRADDPEAVARLRLRKHRPSKPLAVMVRSLEEASSFADLTSLERELLASPENPIVLVLRRHDTSLAAEIAPHLDHVGLLLPTTPLHHLLLDRVSFPIVATSGNRGEEPILAEFAKQSELAELADVVLSHNRPIFRRLDDSVVRVLDGQPSVLRLARGYAPLPLPALERWIGRLTARPAGGVLALGGQQKNAIAMWTGAQAVLGPHVGDLESSRTRMAWDAHIGDMIEVYGVEVRALIADLHPEYAATCWAEQSKMPVLKVAHHHAHAASVMVEHDLLDQRVLAFTWDGTGLGPDGELWGGECLRASLASFERIGTLRPVPLPGCEAAIRQPWRIAIALLRDALGEASDSRWADVPDQAVRGVVQLLERQVQCPLTTSLGRLFDGVASLLLGVSHVSYEGEAAARLEAVADPSIDDAYSVVVEKLEGALVWDWRPTVQALLADHGASTSVRAARFHNSVACWSQIVAKAYPEDDVVLSGGCFQNALLTQRVRRSLESIGKRVYRPGLIPANDGGLAAGQLAIGLAKLAAQG